MRRILILTAALWLAAATAPASRGPAGLLVWIETDRMRLTLYRDGVPAAVYPIAAGRRKLQDGFRFHVPVMIGISGGAGSSPSNSP